MKRRSLSSAAPDVTPFLRAISFAARRHRHQMRKDGTTPYAAHPMRVATIVSQIFGVTDPEVLIAAVLHDTIEDTTTDFDDIAGNFGKRIATWVALLTKDKMLPEEPREDAYFAKLGTAPIEVKLCKLGDTYDNLLDSESLPPAGRKKAAGKARRLLTLYEPGFPPQWRHALDRVRDEMKKVEKGL